jgi:MFS-type transporter involved in bile tolerance (Atg22 family)
MQLTTNHYMWQGLVKLTKSPRKAMLLGTWVVGQVTGTSRLSIIAIVIFFLAGALILATVDYDKGIEAAMSEDEKERSEAGFER